MHQLGRDHLRALVSLLLLLASSPIGMATDPTCEKLRTGKTLIRAFGYGPSTALSLFTDDGMVFPDIEPSRFDDNTHKLDLSGLTAQPIDVHYPALQNLQPGDDEFRQVDLKNTYSFNFVRSIGCHPFLFKGHLAAFLTSKFDKGLTVLGIFDGATATQIYEIQFDYEQAFFWFDGVPVSLTSPDGPTHLYTADPYICIRLRLDYDPVKRMPIFDELIDYDKSCRSKFERHIAITYSGQWMYFFTYDGAVLVQEVRGLNGPWRRLNLKMGKEEQLKMESFINCGETVEEEIDDDKAKVKVKVRATTARPFFRTVPGFTVLCLGILLLVMGAGYYQFYYLPEVERKQKAAEAKAKGKGKMSALKGGRGKRPAKKKRRRGKLRSLWNSISSLASRSMVSKKKAISRSISSARSSVAKVLKRSSAPGSLSPISTPVSTTFSMASGSSAGKFSSGTPSSVLMKGLEEYRLKMARIKARTMKAKRRGRKGKGR